MADTTNPADLLDAVAYLRKVRMRQDMSTVEQLRAEIDLVCGFVESIPSDRLDPWHRITLYADRWHLAHPVTCDLERCPFDAVAAGWSEQPGPLGAYEWSDPDDWGWWPEGAWPGQ